MSLRADIMESITDTLKLMDLPKTAERNEEIMGALGGVLAAVFAASRGLPKSREVFEGLANAVFEAMETYRDNYQERN
jgi:hypothetical protein